MTQEEFIILAGKIAQGKATEQEIAQYNAYFNAYQAAHPAWQGVPAQEKKDMLAETKQEIDGYLLEAGRKKAVKLWPRIVAVAAAVTAITLGVWLYYSSALRHSGSPSSQTAGRDLLNDIAPGRSGATLTLANGETIKLDSAKKGVVVGSEVLYSDGSAVRYSSGAQASDPASPGQKPTGPVGARSLSLSDLQGGHNEAQNLTAQTAKGQTYEFTLPDGTQVWLNADSKLSFPSQFSGRERKILLSGEAYFAVKHMAAKPFRVESRGQVVEDIGTEFNINSYIDEQSVKTTLVEGSARVLAVAHHDKYAHVMSNMAYGSEEGAEPNVLLNPGEQASLKGLRIQVKKVNTEQYISWKNGLFSYDNTPLEEVMRQVARWYNVTVVYSKPDLKNRKFSGTVSRYDKVSGILGRISFTGAVEFDIQGNQIIVK